MIKCDIWGVPKLVQSIERKGSDYLVKLFDGRYFYLDQIEVYMTGLTTTIEQLAEKRAKECFIKNHQFQMELFI